METMSGRVMIDIDVRVSCKCSWNKVEINLKREKEDILLKFEDGKEVNIGSTVALPIPIPYLLFEHINPRYIYPLLGSWLQDPSLCDPIFVKVASEAERVTGPVYISLHVTVTPQKLLDKSSLLTLGKKDMETCAICLVEGHDLCPLPNCSHEFHTDCIARWVCKSFTCPICRAAIDE